MDYTYFHCAKCALWALIVVTQLDGTQIRVQHDQVQILKGRGSECGPGVGAVILVGSRALCVKEKPDVICDKVEKYGGICER